MADLPHSFSAPQRPAGGRLDSWKEIASYLGREVRTVQGWEKNEGLPIHRHQHARQGSVYAIASELDVWLAARHGGPDAPTPPPLDTDAAPQTAGVAGTRRAGRRWMAAAGAVALLAAGAVFLLFNRARQNDVPADTGLSSVVVLPFLDLSPAKDQEYFTDGLTEEVIDSLSRVPNLRVVARTSAFAFKDKGGDVREIGRQLGVGAVLEGSVRKSGDNLRITAQLNRVSDGSHLWSQTYDRPLKDVFSVQRELSQAIASRLVAGEVPLSKGTTNLEAYRLFQEGRYFFNQHEPPESYLKASAKYEEAIRQDPSFALAYAGLADASAYLAEQFVAAPDSVMPRARHAAEQALALDETSADAHTSLGIVKLDYERDRAGAQREFQRAMQLNPSSGYIHHWFAHSLEAQGRMPEAMQEMRASLDLDPLLLPVRWDIANELLCVKRYDAALEETKRMDELFPNLPITAFLKVAAYAGKGDLSASRRVIDALRMAHPELEDVPMFIAMYATADAREGKRAEASRRLEALEQLRRGQYVEPTAVLALCALLHNDQQLMVWLKRADDERSTQFIYLPLHDGEVYAKVPQAAALIAAIH